MNKTKLNEEDLLKALELVTKEGGCPDSLWSPKFGWVMWDGKATETTEDFLEWLDEQD